MPRVREWNNTHILGVDGCRVTVDEKTGRRNVDVIQSGVAC